MELKLFLVIKKKLLNLRRNLVVGCYYSVWYNNKLNIDKKASLHSKKGLNFAF